MGSSILKAIPLAVTMSIACYSQIVRSEMKPSRGKNYIDLPAKNINAREAKLSPDGKFLAVNNDFYADKAELVIFDLNSLKIRQTLTFSKTITDFHFSHDGRYLVSASSNGTVQIFDFRTFSVIATIQRQSNIQEAFFGPGDKYVVINSPNLELALYDIAKNTIVKEVNFANGYFINKILVSPDGRYLVYGWSDCFGPGFGSCKKYSISVLDLVTLNIVKTMSQNHPFAPREISPDSRYFVFGSMDSNLKVFDLQTLGIAEEIQNSDGSYHSIFSLDGQFFYFGGLYELNRYEFRTKKVTQEFQTKNMMSSVSFSPDGKYFVSLSSQDNSFLYDLNRKVVLVEIPNQLANPEDLDRPLSPFGANSQYFATCDNGEQSNGINVYNLKLMKLVHYTVPELFNSTCSNALIAPDGKTLVAVYYYGLIRLFKLN